MNVKEWLDDIEWEIETAGLEPPDRRALLRWMSAELNVLSGRIHSDIFNRHLDPAVTTTESTRYYDLPHDFGLNFKRRGDGWICMLDNGSNETQLDYISNTEFFSQDLLGQSDGTPTKYTIVSKPNGYKQIGLSPTPDTNSDDNYTIDGLYTPTDWKLRDEDSIPVLPANSPVLKFAVLRRVSRQVWEADYREALQYIMVEAAKQRRASIQPTIDREY